MSSETADDVSRLIRLVAMSLVIGRKQTEQIAILTKASFSPKEIAELLGTTPNAVRVALSNLRKKGPLKLPGPETKEA